MPHPTLPDHQLIVFASSQDFLFGVLHSRIHQVWSLAQGTQLREKESGFRYTPTTCFETFPFPFSDDLQPPNPAPPSAAPPTGGVEPNGGWDTVMATRFYKLKEEPPAYGGAAPGKMTPEQHRAAISAAAKELNDLRERWLNPPEWTVERILEFPGTVGGPWDRYLDPSTIKPQLSTQNSQLSTGLVRYPRLEPRDADCAAKLKKRTLTNLYNERPAWLHLAHQKLDAAVAAAYHWPPDLTDDQILEKLLALNLDRAAEEAKAAKTHKPTRQRAKTNDELV